MPNINTHVLFARELLQNPKIQKWVRDPHLFQVGNNGPDFLFFHHVSPVSFYESTPLRKLGNELHKEKVNEFYAAALKRIRQEKNPYIQEEMLSYLCGHLAHWALDSTVHPYIFYRTGNCKGRSAWNHHRMESLIDSAMLKIKNDYVAEEPLSVTGSKTSREQKEAVALLYSHILNDLYGTEITPSMIAESLFDWNEYQKMILDPKEEKVKWFRLAEKPVRLENLFSGLFVPESFDDNHDLLNLNHSVWKHPVTETENRLSFLELYDQAQKKAEEGISLLLKAFLNPAKEKELFEFIEDRNYNMGMPSGPAPHLFNVTDFGQ